MHVVTRRGPYAGVYRTSGPRNGAAGMAVVAVGALVWGVLTSHVGAKIFLIVVAAFGAVMAWRMMRVGTYVEPSGVRVVNYVRTFHVPYEVIDQFVLRPAGRYPYVGHVLRKDGRRPVIIVGIESPPGESEESRRKAQAAIDPLNNALAEWRESHPAG